MKVSLVPVLESLRSIYNAEGVMPRFEAYTNLMTAGQEVLPLGAFSPMGRAQPRYLDQLLDMNAESIAEKAAEQATKSLQGLDDRFKLALVVVDAPNGHNTWTDRYVTDAEWRLETKYDAVPLNNNRDFDRWITVQLWTDQDPPTPRYIQQETLASIYRATHQTHVLGGAPPTTLQDMLYQEGRSLAFANRSVAMEPDDLEYSKQVLRDLLHSDHYPTCFAAMYGDVAANQVGYSSLGLSSMAGFQVGLSHVLETQDQNPNYLLDCLSMTKATNANTVLN